MLKTCKTCKEQKSGTLEFFNAHRETRDRLSVDCKVCVTKRATKWKQDHSVELATKRRAEYAADSGARHKDRNRRRRERNPIGYSAEVLQRGLRDRMRKQKLFVADELLNKQFVCEWLERQPNCECCGVAFNFGLKNTGCKSDASPSFDQIKPGQGYPLENVALICWRCNNIKRNYTSEDLWRVAEWLERKLIARGDQIGLLDTGLVDTRRQPSNLAAE